MQRTEEQWRAVPFEDVRAACESAGLSREGTIEVLAARLAVYYREVSAEQTVLQQLASTQHPHSQRYHPYPTTTTDSTISSTLREHEALLAQYNSALNRIEHMQQQSWGTTTTTASTTFITHPTSSTGLSWCSPMLTSATPTPNYPAPSPLRPPGPGPLPASVMSANTGSGNSNLTGILATFRDTITESISSSITAALSALGGSVGGSLGQAATSTHGATSHQGHSFGEHTLGGGQGGLAALHSSSSILGDEHFRSQCVRNHSHNHNIHY